MPSIAYGLANQTARVVLAHAGEILHHQIDRMLIAFQRTAAFLALPQLRLFLENLAHLARRPAAAD